MDEHREELEELAALERDADDDRREQDAERYDWQTPDLLVGIVLGCRLACIVLGRDDEWQRRTALYS